MGLSMAQKRALTNEIARRYRRADKLGKKTILDEFCVTSGYHRKYATALLNRWGTTELLRMDGKLVKVVVGNARKRAKRPERRVYDKPVQSALRQVWEFFDYQCGKRLVPLLRANLDVLRVQPELRITEEVAAKLARISPAPSTGYCSRSEKGCKSKVEAIRSMVRFSSTRSRYEHTISGMSVSPDSSSSIRYTTKEERLPASIVVR